MKICRFKDPETQRARFGMIEDGAVYALAAEVSEGTLSVVDAEPVARLEEARLLAPVEPSKVVCVGRNYQEHAAELGNAMPTEPLLFLKAPSAIVGDGETIKLPRQSERVEHEGELAVVIGRRGRF